MNAIPVNHLPSPLPRWAVETAFGIMLFSAALSPTAVSQYMFDHCAWLKALINTAGDVVLYWALLRGMQTLRRPLTGWWAAVIVLVACGGVTMLLRSVEVWHEVMETADVIVAALLPLVYIPLGVQLLFIYRGALARVGVWMIVRSVVGTLLPVVWVLLEVPDGFVTLDVLYILVTVAYAWSIRRVLVEEH
ncbi:MAG: hypothetical protein IJR09_03310 [Paludibacteraceae bacterium]|nr:hypothetical protein [Paludibacteraceae bacterium]MBQ6748446.1 hypothetical protein [Paludibacteraceae bacterium]MBR0064241.1 hypothetical protein [Paludibacteraceae bacterium]